MTKTKRLGFVLLTIAIIMLFAALFSMRTGFTACAQEVIDISDEQSLVNLAKEVAAGDNKLGAVYRVMSDIVVTDETFVPVGTERTNFEGVVEGNGHTVTYNVESTESGLFGYLGSNGTVRNLIVKGSAKGKIVGGVAGVNKGRIEECVSEVALAASGDNFTGASAGGIAGENAGVIVSCVNTGTIKFAYCAGGVAGRNTETGNVVSCVNFGAIDASAYAVGNTLGGIVGLNEGSICDSYVDSGIKTVAKTNVGAIVGDLSKIGNSARVYAINATQTLCSGKNASLTDKAFKNSSLYDFLSDEGVEINGMSRLDYDLGYGYVYAPDFLCENRFSNNYYAYKTYFERLLFDSHDKAENKFTISTKEQWKLFVSNSRLYDYENHTVSLSNALSLGKTDSAGAENVRFAGKLIGNGYEIAFVGSNALFLAAQNAEFKGVTLKGEVNSANEVGALIGNAYGTVKISDAVNYCSVGGKDNVGGIIGTTDASGEIVLTNVRNYGAISGGNNVGGIIGAVNGKAQYKNLANYGKVTSSANGAVAVGGIIGYSCVAAGSGGFGLLNEGEIKAEKSNGVGGIIGIIASESAVADYESATATATISGRNYVGGIIGRAASEVTVKDFISICAIKGVNYLGGAVGYNESAITLICGVNASEFTEDTSMSKDKFNFDAVACGTDQAIYNFEDVRVNEDLTATTEHTAGTKYVSTVALCDGKEINANWLSAPMDTDSGYYPMTNAEYVTDKSVYKRFFFDSVREGVYCIETAQAMKNFTILCNDYNGYEGLSYALTDDVTLKGEFSPVKRFCGIFSGNGYSISGIKANGERVALFLDASGAEIKNLSLSGEISASYEGASFALVTDAKTAIEWCYSSVDLTAGDRGGGLVLQNNGKIYLSFYDGELRGSELGGIVNENNESGAINYSFSSGIIVGAGKVGGIATFNKGKINGCYIYGYVEGNLVGGIAYSNEKVVSNCVVRAGVKGVTDAGAICFIRAGENAITKTFYNRDEISYSAWPGVSDEENEVFAKSRSYFYSDGPDEYRAFKEQTYNAEYDAYYGYLPEGLIIWTETDSRVYERVERSSRVDVYGRDYLSTDDNGSQNNPYRIYDKNDFDTLSILAMQTSYSGKYFRIMNDIDFNGASTYSIGAFEDSVKTTNYMFDGIMFSDGNYAIKNIKIIGSRLVSGGISTDNVGFFGYTGSNFLLKNLRFDGEVGGGNGVGSLVGHMVGGKIDGVYSSVTVKGGSLACGLVGTAEGTAAIVNCIYDGLIEVDASGNYYGICGTRVSDSKNTWYVLSLNDYSSYAHNQIGNLLYADENSAAKANVNYVYSEEKGYGMEINAKEPYKAFVMNTNDSPLNDGNGIYYPIDGKSVSEGKTSLTYFIRYCLQASVGLADVAMSDVATVSVGGNGYYYPGQTVRVTLKWNKFGYKFGSVADKNGNVPEYGLSNTAENTVIGFIMTDSTESVAVEIQKITPVDGKTTVIDFAEDAVYSGESKLSAVNLAEYSVTYYRDGKQTDDMKRAGKYLVHVCELNGGVIVGIYEEEYEIVKKTIDIDTALLASEVRKTYDRSALCEITADSDKVTYITGTINGEVVRIKFTFELASANVGENLLTTLKSLVFLTGDDDYRADESLIGSSLGEIGVIEKNKITVALQDVLEAVANNGTAYLYVKGEYVNAKPSISYTASVPVEWTFVKVDENLTADVTWNERAGYSVGLYKIIPAISTSAGEVANNYEIVYPDYYYLIERAYVYEIDYEGVDNLRYNGSDLSASVKCTYVVDGTLHAVALEYYEKIAFTAGAIIPTDKDYFYIDRGMLVKAAEERFIQSKDYFALTNEIKNANDYYVLPQRESGNYIIECLPRKISVSKADGEAIAYELYDENGRKLEENSEVTVGDRIKIKFTDETTKNGYDGAFVVVITESAQGGFEIEEVDGEFYFIPTAYGQNVKFYISGRYATNYNDRVSGYNVLNVKAGVLYVDLEQKAFVYGENVTLRPVYYLDKECTEEMPEAQISGLQSPVFNTATTVYNCATYELTYSGGSSDGYNFIVVAKSITVTPYEIIVSVSGNVGKTYGDSDPIIEYMILKRIIENGEETLVRAETLPNGNPIIVNGSLGRTLGENKGTYDLTYGTLTAENNPNYKIVYNIDAAKFIISRREVVLRVKDGQGKEYGNDDERYELELKEGYSLYVDKDKGIEDTMEIFYAFVFVTREEGENKGLYEYIVSVDNATMSLSNYYVSAIESEDVYYKIGGRKPNVYVTLTGIAYYGDVIANLAYTGWAKSGDIDVRGVFEIFSDHETFSMTDTSVNARFIPDNENYDEVEVKSLPVTVQKRSIKATIFYKDDDTLLYADGLQILYRGKAFTSDDFTVSFENLATDDEAQERKLYKANITVTGDSRNVTSNGFKVSVSLTSDCYALTGKEEVGCTVTKALVTVTCESASITYGDAYQPKIKYSGFLGGDTEKVLTKKAQVLDLELTLGYHTLLASGAEAQNYDFTYVAGIVAVSAKQIEADGVKIIGNFAPTVKLEVVRVGVDNAYFAAMSKQTDSALGYSLLVPGFKKMAAYVDISLSETYEEENEYEITFDYKIKDGDIVYYVNSVGKLEVAEYEIISSTDNETTVSFKALNATGAAVYSAKSIGELAQAFMLYIIAGGVLLLAVILGVVISYAKKKHKTEKRSMNAFRGRFVRRR